MKAPIKRYPLHQCALYNCSSKKKLEHRLKLNAGGASLLENMIQYHKFSIPKKDSTQLRDITAPADALKKVAKVMSIMAGHTSIAHICWQLTSNPFMITANAITLIGSLPSG